MIGFSKVIFAITVSVCLAVLCVDAYASRAENIYQGRAIVTSQTTSEQSKAIRAALAQVLVKVTGQSGITEQAEVKQILDRARERMIGFSYEIADQQMYLVANFDEEKINRVLIQNSLPIWDKQRPETLVWLAVQDEDDEFRRQLLQEDSETHLKDVMFEVAQVRGITVALPQLGLSERENISVFDVWGGFTQAIAKASEVYSQDFVLSFRVLRSESFDTSEQSEVSAENAIPYVFRDNTQLSEDELKWQDFLQRVDLSDKDHVKKAWTAEWQHFAANRPEVIRRGKLSADTPADVVTQLVNLIVDMMASDLALETLSVKERETISIQVMNVKSLQDYKAMLDTLSAMLIVENAWLDSLTGDQATVQVRLSGTREDFTNALKLSSNITPVTDDFGEAIAPLLYRWQQAIRFRNTGSEISYDR